MGKITPFLLYENIQPFDPDKLVDIAFNPPGNENSVATTPSELKKGVNSLFNPYAVVAFPSFNGEYNSILDSSEVKFFPDGADKYPYIENLVNDEKFKKKEPYGYSDFLYCKYVGKIPNTQLITLRRYPAPTYDNLAVPGQLVGETTQRNVTYKDVVTGATVTTTINDFTPKKENGMPVLEPEQDTFYPIAQAVTWFGEQTENKLSDILSFSVNFNWKAYEAEVNAVSGNEQGSEDTPAPAAAKYLGMLTGQVNSPWATANSQYDPYNNGPYAHRVYGPVNVISKTYKRDRGLDFKQSITINFHYSLKSIGNINPKAAMLDLMSNMLALTYNNAAFWGGANRYFPQKPTYPFLGGKDGMNAWYRGDAVGFAQAIGKQISAAGTAFMDMLGKLAEDPISALKSLAAGAAKLGMVEMGKGRAPNIVALRSLLTGEPIGEWHMVVGNPYNPIAKIGNLIVTESKFKFNDIVGAEDFPTELSVAITLEHGRPRDKGDIESMFNQGQGRIYYPRLDKEDLLNMSSATRNSTNDSSWKKGGGINMNYTTLGLFTGTSEEYDNILGSIKGVKPIISDSAKNSYNLARDFADRWANSKKINK